MRHLTYANLTATLALIFSMAGGALAANHYLITSTKQIKPSVLRSLRSREGPLGPQGPAGPQGAPANESTVKQLQSQVATLKEENRGLCQAIWLANLTAISKPVGEPAWNAIHETLNTIERDEANCIAGVYWG